MSSLTVLQTSDAILAWMAQSYSDQHVPVGLLKRLLAAEVPTIALTRIDAAVRFAIDQGFLQPYEMTSDGQLVALTNRGLEQGRALLQNMASRLQVGQFTDGAAAAVEKITEAFRSVLRTTAAAYANEGASPAEPYHVYLAARVLASGELARTIEELDKQRDKSADRGAEDRLLAQLWKAP